MDINILKNYAKLTVHVGVNVQKNQYVEIFSDVKNYEFVSMVQEEAYKRGAKFVNINWSSEDSKRINFKNADTEVLGNVPKYVVEQWEERTEVLPAMIHILSDDPDSLKDIEPEKLSKVRQLQNKVIMPIRHKMSEKYTWTIVGVPSVKWANKVFPNLNDEEALEKLWDAIFKTARVYGDPILNWNKHNDFIHDKCKLLNSYNFKSLKYKSSNGTDFKIDLLDELQFMGGGSYTKQGLYYNPNMPTEECFTSPDKDSAEGYLFASKPLSLNGVLIKDFGFKFEKGKVIEIFSQDEQSKKILEGLINNDDSSSKLGEVALVSYDSPVNQTGLLFYNTLYDENACCHFALGYGFDDCIKGFEKMTDEEINKININRSLIHVDFMIGTSDLSIKGITKDGKEIDIFIDGTWAI